MTSKKLKTNEDGTVNVITVIVSTTGATFYTKEGQTVNMAASDHRCQALINDVQAAINGGEVPVRVDFGELKVFSQIEKDSGGLIKFFRVAKKAVKRLLGSSAERGNVKSGGFERNAPKGVTVGQPGTDALDKDVVSKLLTADAQSANLPDDQTTTVAVVGNTPIVGAEALKGHAASAVKQQNTLGFRKFMERLAKVAKNRKHTAQELLKFMEKNDLPIADDGCIVAYKSLTKTSEEGIWVDNHSQSLKQTVGSIVKMDAEMVDDNRRVLCSNGLHIARKGYLNSYGSGSTNIVTIVKIAPEHVISVPMGEQDKMRVMQYFIVAELTVNERNALSRSQRIDKDNPDIGKLLGNVLAGRHGRPRYMTYKKKNGTTEQMAPILKYGAFLYDFDTNASGRFVSTITDSKMRDANARLDPGSLNKESGVPEQPKPSPKPEPKPKAAPKPKGKAKAKGKAKKKTELPNAVQRKAIKALKEGKLSKTEIAKKYGTSPRTLGRWVDKFGMPE